MVNQMVISDEIEWIGYEPSRSMLQVEFIDGPIYQYDNVPHSVYIAFLEADSYDQFLKKHVQDHYSCRRVR